MPAGPCLAANPALRSTILCYTGEYALAALLAITFMYTLAFSHTSLTHFSAGNQHTKHWWKARHDVPGWAEQHQRYVEEAIAASQSSVRAIASYALHCTAGSLHFAYTT